MVQLALRYLVACFVHVTLHVSFWPRSLLDDVRRRFLYITVLIENLKHDLILGCPRGRRAASRTSGDVADASMCASSQDTFGFGSH